ncbi:signal peptidase I [bacterium]|nr:signal peptidase I [candidate division CSSED10-310 bacterium]
MPAMIQTSVSVHVISSLLQDNLVVKTRVFGESMAPMIKNGDVITIERIDPQSVRPGDILACVNSAEILVVHRLIQINSNDNGHNIFILKGDTQTCCDAPILSSQILGRVTTISKPNSSVGPSLIDITRSPWRQINTMYTYYIRFKRSTLIKRCLHRNQ